MITYIVIPYRKTADNNALYSILQTLKTVLENNSEAVFFTRKQLNALFQAVLRQSKRTSTFYQNWRPDMAEREGFICSVLIGFLLFSYFLKMSISSRFLYFYYLICTNVNCAIFQKTCKKRVHELLYNIYIKFYDFYNLKKGLSSSYR